MNFQKDKKSTIATPTILSLPSPIKKIAAGPNHSYAIAKEELYHWGARHTYNKHNQFDQSVQKNSNQQAELSRQLTVIPLAIEHLSTNRHHTFAWKGYNVYCWGSNHSYELGMQDEKYYEPVHMPVLEKAISQGYELNGISCGQHHTLAVLYRKSKEEPQPNQSQQSEILQKSQDYDDSSHIQLYAWGQSESYQLTINSTSIIPYPVLTPCSFKHLDKIYSESDYNAALCNGKVYTWGCNIFSRLGQPISSSQLPKVRIPREVALPERITKIGIGVYHAVAVGDSGAAYAWGKGNQGQLGIDHYETESKPTKMLCDEPISQVSCGQAHTMVLLADGRLKTCGSNSHDVLGHSEYNPKDKKKRCKKLEFVKDVEKIGKIKMICCGNSHNLVLNSEGKVYGWGSNNYGQLLSEQEQMANDSAVSFSSKGQSSISKEAPHSNSKDAHSFSKDHKALQITIDIDYMHRQLSLHNNSLTYTQRLQNWKHRYNSFLAQKQRQQQQFMRELEQLTKEMAQHTQK